MYSVGEAVTINCADTTGSSNLVQWLNSTDSETVLTSSSTSSVTLTINTVTDRHHGRKYICRIQSPGDSRDIHYTIIILSEFTLFSKMDPEKFIISIFNL